MEYYKLIRPLEDVRLISSDQYLLPVGQNPFIFLVEDQKVRNFARDLILSLVHDRKLLSVVRIICLTKLCICSCYHVKDAHLAILHC